MPIIEVITYIDAPPACCFALALNVDLHALSARQTGEQIVGGVRHGQLQLHDSVTFRARHFGVWQILTSQITALETPRYFRDEMQQGAFRWMRHEHFFEPVGPAATCMRDVFAFESPLGVLGQIADWLVLRRYLRRFLVQRGTVLKQHAEEQEKTCPSS